MLRQQPKKWQKDKKKKKEKKRKSAQYWKIFNPHLVSELGLIILFLPNSLKKMHSVLCA